MIKYDFSLLTPPPTGEQNTEAWLNARRGRITASKRAHQILYSRESTISTMMDQMAEELQHPAEEGFSNVHTRHGHAFEEQAINEYDMARVTFGDIEKSPGMFVHPDFDIASATPDFFEGDDTTGQIKCPSKIHNHNSLLHFGVKEVSANYYTQIQFESFVTGRPKIVFVSYHPDAPATNQLHYENIAADKLMHDVFRKKLAWIDNMLVNDFRPEVKKIMAGVDGIPDLF
jgi:hypothetical protein